MAQRYKIGETKAEGPVVPESLKKKCERNAGLAKAKAAALKELKDKRKAVRKEGKSRASKYEREYRQAAKQVIATRRQCKATGNFYVEPEAKVMFVIRITGVNKLAPKPRKILKLLRLDQLHKGVFVKCTRPMLNMLKYIQPYVICGYPTLATTKKLVLKRGYAKVNRERRPIHNNDIISDNLGKYGLHTLDDVIHEIYTVGPNFKQANNFMWAFKLNTPNGGYVLKKHGYHEPKGGDWGNREELINELLNRMM